MLEWKKKRNEALRTFLVDFHPVSVPVVWAQVSSDPKEKRKF